MPLDSLLSLVEKLRERIDAHGSKLRQSEALTRYALIDPLLRELGWDTGNPDLVVPEYKVGGGRADYALLNNGKPTMMVEAKSLESPLQDALSQGIGYCLEQGTPYFSVTDGRRWEIYETHRPVPIDEKRIAEFDLKDGPAAEASLKALALWRPNVDSGRIGPGQAPVIVPTPNRSAQPEFPIPKTQQTPPPDKPETGWQPISELNPRSESHPPPPSAVQFPDNSNARVSAWAGGQRGLLVQVVRWLVNGNHLTENCCPILITPRGTRYLVSTGPVDSMRDHNQVGSFYIYTNLTHSRVIDACRTIIRRAEQDPAQFKVRFS